MDLTGKQLETLQVIGAMEQTLDRFPTLRELTDQLGLKSHVSTYDRLLSLRAKGLLEYQKLKNRNESPFELTAEAKRYIHWIGFEYSSSGSSSSAQVAAPSNQPTSTDQSVGHKQEMSNLKVQFKNAFADTGVALSTLSPETARKSFFIACAFLFLGAVSTLQSWSYPETVLAFMGIYLMFKNS